MFTHKIRHTTTSSIDRKLKDYLVLQWSASLLER